MNEQEAKTEIQKWIVSKSKTADSVEFDTQLLSEKVISSLQIMELILFLEKLSGQKVKPEALKPGSFTDINTIYSAFLQGPA